MEPTAAVETTRTLLTHLAEDATFGPLMNDFLATYRDDELVADVILTVGLVATVLLMAAAIEFEGQIGSVKFKKGKVDHKMISAVLGPFAKALGGSPRR